MKNNPKYIIVHCSDVSYKISTDQLKSINVYHRDVRGFPVSSLGYYVGYHRLITGGKNTQCRLDSDEGAHCNQVKDGLSMNFQSLGVCIGFDGDEEMPSPFDTKVLQDQIWRWQDQYKISNDRVYFHRDFATNKTCPGSLITREWLDRLLIREPEAAIEPKPPVEPMVDLGMVMRLIAWLRKNGIIK